MDINFLYCFDQNYNKQAFVSIMSIIKNLDVEFSLHIIHNEPSTFLSQKKIIEKDEKVKQINIYKFKNPNLEFPNLKNAHVSVATYYRMFIEDYIPKEIDTLIYIDPDIICLNNPKKSINTVLKDLVKSEYLIAARETGTRKNENSLFQRLVLESDSYFNAGLMFIDYKKWINIKEKLIHKMEKNFEKIIFWDQDVLNLYFDGKFLKIENILNFNVTKNFNEINYINTTLSKVIFLHYSGKVKPWTLMGIELYYSKFYHDIFRKYNSEKYHIEISGNKFNFIFASLKTILSLKFLKLKYPMSYAKIIIKKIVQVLFTF